MRVAGGGAPSRAHPAINPARPAAPVAADDLTLTGGRADRGGAVWNAGTLTLTRVVLSDNQAVGAAGAETWGGAIHNVRGTLALSQVTLTRNRAVGTPGQIARGGAVSGADEVVRTANSAERPCG